MLNSNPIDIRKTNRIKTFGDSMYPLLHDGDVVYFEKISFDEIKINDIVIVYVDNLFYTHRVIYKADMYLITKGDNNLKPDKLIVEDNVVGKVKYIVRNKNKIDIEHYYLMQSTLYLQAITKILNLLKQHNISFLILKGLPLHLYYEQAHPRRLYSDCDILIAVKDRVKLNDLFLKNNYNLHPSDIKYRFDENIPQLTYVSTVNKFPICFDVHFNPSLTTIHIDTKDALFSSATLAKLSNEFLLKKRTITYDDNCYYILAREHLIVYLILHYFHHNYKGIFRLEFLHTIILQETKDQVIWKGIEKLIIKYNLQNIVYPVFILLKKYYNTKLSSEFLQRIKPKHIYMQYLIHKFFLDISPFEDETWLTRGINRFIYLLLLSPNPWPKKITVFLNKEVLNMILLVTKKRFIFTVKWLFIRSENSRTDDKQYR